MPPLKHIELGQYCELQIARIIQHGAILTDGQGEILLPGKEVPRGAAIGDRLEVFILTDSEDRPIATRRKPVATIGKFALMECVTVNKIGAFFNWGLDKDLLVPFAEQKNPLREGHQLIVRVIRDDISGRIIGSTRLKKFLKLAGNDVQIGDRVSILPYYRASDALLVIVDDRYLGAVFADEEVQPMQVGKRVTGFVKAKTEDGRLALALRPQGYQAAVVDQAPLVIDRLKAAGGSLPYGDKSDPVVIQQVFGISKGAFKKLIGRLYKEGVILIDDNGIRLR